MEYLDMATKRTETPSDNIIAALDELTYDQLNAVAAATQEKLSAKKAQARDELRAEFLEKARAHGFDIAEIMERPRQSKGAKGGTVEAKYRNPSTGETYSGRGMMPRWMKEKVDAGASKEDFLIKK